MKNTHQTLIVWFRISIVLILVTTKIGAFDFQPVKDLYKEGEFLKIRVTLEDFLKKSGKTASPKEKIFAYKYLGVAYAADPNGYALAETYFYQLLKLAPNAYLSDLYVSKPIESLFEKTKERFLKESRQENAFDEFGNPRAKSDLTEPSKREKEPEPIHPTSEKVKSERAIWPWVVVGIGVGVGVGAYFWLSSPKTQDKVISAPKP